MFCLGTFLSKCDCWNFGGFCLVIFLSKCHCWNFKSKNNTINRVLLGDVSFEVWLLEFWWILFGDFFFKVSLLDFKSKNNTINRVLLGDFPFRGSRPDGPVDQCAVSFLSTNEWLARVLVESSTKVLAESVLFYFLDIVFLRIFFFNCYAPFYFSTRMVHNHVLGKDGKCCHLKSESHVQ